MVERNKDCPFPSHAGMWNCKKTKKKKKKRKKKKKKNVEKKKLNYCEILYPNSIHVWSYSHVKW